MLWYLWWGVFGKCIWIYDKCHINLIFIWFVRIFVSFVKILVSFVKIICQNVCFIVYRYLFHLIFVFEFCVWWEVIGECIGSGFALQPNLHWTQLSPTSTYIGRWNICSTKYFFCYLFIIWLIFAEYFSGICLFDICWISFRNLFCVSLTFVCPPAQPALDTIVSNLNLHWKMKYLFN